MIYLGGGDVTTEIKTGRGYVYCLHYHVVWCIKYRHKIMTKEIVDDLYKIITKIAYDNGFEILEYNTDQDYVHILISCSPQNFIPDIMKALKGVSARLLMKKHGNYLREKLWGGHLWNPSYFIATVSENAEEQVKQYIKSQGNKKSS